MAGTDSSVLSTHPERTQEPGMPCSLLWAVSTEAVPLNPQHPVAKSLPRLVPPSLTGCSSLDKVTCHAPSRHAPSPCPPHSQCGLPGGFGFQRGGATHTTPHAPPHPPQTLESSNTSTSLFILTLGLALGKNCNRGGLALGVCLGLLSIAVITP